MAAPEVAEQDDDDDATPSPDGPGGDPLDDAKELAEDAEQEADAPEPEGEPTVEEVDLTDDDLTADGSDLFTGTEDAQKDSTSDESDAEGDGSDESDDADDDDVLDALDARGESMETAINEGVARLAVVGLDDDERGDLEDEFTEVFEAFRLGYFGSRFAEEYVFAADDEEVDPTWGLVGAMLVCTAFTVWMRPDGDELVGRAREAVENIAGGSL